jgi:hypothetical protein
MPSYGVPQLSLTWDRPSTFQDILQARFALRMQIITLSTQNQAAAPKIARVGFPL